MNIKIPDFMGLAQGLYGLVVFLVMALILWGLVVRIVQGVRTPLAIGTVEPYQLAAMAAFFWVVFK